VSTSWYKSFAELSQSEREGVSYQRRVKRRRSKFVIIAPHGGGIEPGTSEIACSIAGPLFSYYVFDGLRRAGNELLHITSTLFDEPTCLNLVNDSQVVVAIHGCAGEEKFVYVGGLHNELKTRLIEALLKAGFDARLAGGDYAGLQLENICNCGQSGRGVQLEITESLRRTMFKGLSRTGRKITTEIFREFVVLIHKELVAVTKEDRFEAGKSYFI
jgi:phage replication-related protein YjqB (UPF0714/DUF867 family)